MKFNVEDINEEDYSYLFYSMELMEIIGFDEPGKNITVQEFTVNPKSITFLLKVDEYIYDISISFTYDGKIANIILYKGNDCLNFEVDRNKKEIIRMMESNYVNNCLLRKTTTYDGDNDIYVYEYVEYNTHKEILIKFKLDAVIELDDKLNKFLYQNNCSLEELVTFLKDTYPFIPTYLIKVEENREIKWYYVKNGLIKEIDYNFEPDDIVKNKVYKYN